MTLETLLVKIRLLNKLRYGVETGAESARLAELEAYFENGFSAGCKLAVYGSLAPGRINHQVVAGIRGRWEGGLAVRGELIQQGWGASLGYPALKWLAEGSVVPVQLLVSEQLPQHWPRLDAFEGAEYQRVLAPVYRAGTFITVANLYELRRAENKPASSGTLPMKDQGSEVGDSAPFDPRKNRRKL